MDTTLLLRILFVVVIARLAYVENKLYKQSGTNKPNKYFVLIGYILFGLIILLAIYKLFLMS